MAVVRVAGGREDAGAAEQRVREERADGQPARLRVVHHGAGVPVARDEDVAAQSGEVHGIKVESGEIPHHELGDG